jgi:hypothetical protein
MVKAQFLAPLFLLAFLTAIAVPVKATPITSCGTYNDSDVTYYLQNDLLNITAHINVNGYNACILLTGNNTIFDCQGHLIEGIKYPFPPLQSGISIHGDYTTIKNCRLSSWRFSGITNYYVYPEHWTIENVTIGGVWGASITMWSWHHSGTEYGIIRNVKVVNTSYTGYDTTIFSSVNNLIIENTIVNVTDNEEAGIIIYGRSIVRNSIIDNSGYGIHTGEGLLINGGNSIVENSVINNNGIRVVEETNVSIYNNLMNASSISIYPSSLVVKLNTTRQSGTNIIGGGIIGGNYWTNSTGNGYSNTCTDLNQDGICDSPLVWETNAIDYLPLSDYYRPPTTTIPPCQVCDIRNLPIGSMGLGAIPGAFVCGMLNIMFCVPILFVLALFAVVGIYYWRKLKH